jgi:hypothetical protein
MWLINRILCIAGGYFTYTCSSADSAGKKNKLDMWLSGRTGKRINTSLNFSFKFPNPLGSFALSRVNVHIHHWLYLFLLGSITSFEPLQMFCLGGMAQGIVNYEDWYKIIWIH